MSSPRKLPLSLPSRLVEQRPDIRAAEAQLHAASAQIGVAMAARFPNITLTASGGSAALEEALYEQALAQYRSTMMTGFQNVADTLQVIQSDARALSAAVAAEQAASKSLAIARRQWELGAVGYLSVLSAEQAYQQASIGLVQARANRFSDTAALFQALGGGWWNRADAVQSSRQDLGASNRRAYFLIRSNSKPRLQCSHQVTRRSLVPRLRS